MRPLSPAISYKDVFKVNIHSWQRLLSSDCWDVLSEWQQPCMLSARLSHPQPWFTVNQRHLSLRFIPKWGGRGSGRINTPTHIGYKKQSHSTFLGPADKNVWIFWHIFNFCFLVKMININAAQVEKKVMKAWLRNDREGEEPTGMPAICGRRTGRDSERHWQV